MSLHETSDKLKENVREKYAEISRQSKTENENSCCGSGCGCSTVDYTIFSEDYSSLEGYTKEADLGLGCGLPTEFAHISKGDTVVDLGSGAGNDCFVARKLTGHTGEVIGIDMTMDMIKKARENVANLGYDNVRFISGDIEDMPLDANIADVVVSNCVLNLVPDKKKAFAETYRILKPGGHFSISDIVISGELPEALRKDAEMYAGCVSGAIEREKYLQIVKETGFRNVTLQKERKIELPRELLSNYLNNDELRKFKDSEVGIYSITLYAEKAK